MTFQVRSLKNENVSLGEYMVIMKVNPCVRILANLVFLTIFNFFGKITKMSEK